MAQTTIDWFRRPARRANEDGIIFQVFLTEQVVVPGGTTGAVPIA